MKIRYIVLGTAAIFAALCYFDPMGALVTYSLEGGFQ